MIADPPAPVTAILCTRGREAMLGAALETLGHAVARVPGATLTVVVQGDSDVEAICRSVGVAATVIHDDGVGVCRARNLAVRRATAPVLAFTDDDCSVPASWLVDHLAALTEDGLIATCGAVTGLPRHGDDDLSIDPAAADVRHRRGTPPWAIGHSSNLAVTRAALVAIGGFDERIGPGAPRVTAGDDGDLLVRLVAIGDIRSGVGEPVRHLGWRAPHEVADRVLAYERGTGAWLGKLLVVDPRLGALFLRARIRMLRTDVSSRARPRAAAALASGVLQGLVLSRRPVRMSGA